MGDTGVLLVLGGLAVAYFWNLSNAVNNLQFYPGDITGFDLLPPTLYVNLNVQNTSNITFTINSLAASVTSDGTLIGNISDFTPVVISANGQGAIPLTVRLLPIGIANDIISIYNGGSGNRTITINGSVNANGTQQSFSLSFKIGI